MVRDSEENFPLVEYAYNNTEQSSIGKTPFEVIYGKVLLPPILRTKDKIFAADEYVRDLEIAYEQVKKAISRTQDKQKKAADKKCRPLELKKEQGVFLKFEKTRLWRPGKEGKAIKLANRYYGPFQITKSINYVPFRLALPPLWRIHNACHISLL